MFLDFGAHSSCDAQRRTQVGVKDVIRNRFRIPITIKVNLSFNQLKDLSNIVDYGGLLGSILSFFPGK